MRDLPRGEGGRGGEGFALLGLLPGARAPLSSIYISKGSRARRVEAFFLCGRQGSSLESRVRRSDLRAGLEQVARSY